MKWLFVLLQAVTSLKFESCVCCFWALNCLWACMCRFKVVLLEKQLSDSMTFFFKFKWFHFCCFGVNDYRPEETPSTQTQSLRGLETWGIKIMGEVILNDWWYQVREGAKQGRAGVCVADQKQLYSSISAMKIATHVKVDVFTEKRTRKKKTERKRDLFRGELCNL